MLQNRWFFRPLSIFILSIVALGLSLFIYIRSYLEVNEAFTKFLVTHNFDPDQFAQTQTWVVILVLSLLVALIIIGLLMTYFTYQKSYELYRLQKNFINGFTHELKTPIASLRLYLDTFLKHQLDPKQQKQYLEYMIDDTNRLSSNVQQILSLAKLEEKKYQLNLTKFNLKQFLEEIIHELSRRHSGSQIELEYIDLDTEELFYADQDLLRLLIVNLIENGLYHNLSEDPQIVIRCSKVDKGVKFQVSDNGVGLDKKQLKKVFRKFYQVGYSVKGSGIGLYMAQIVVKYHRGKISVHSEGKDKGATFEVFLPWE